MLIKVKKLFVVFAAIFLVFGLVSCDTDQNPTSGTSASKTTSTTTTDKPDETFAAVGEYEIDIAKLGMPLVFYLKIDNDKNFKLSNTRAFEADKGHGVVRKSGETYVMVFSDSTQENPKTASFTLKNRNLLFSTSLPYGSSNIPAQKEDEDNPEVIHFLLAKVYAYEDMLKEYAGSHSVTAGGMGGSPVVYQYYVMFKPGYEFYFHSEFEMGGELYEYEERGTFVVSGTVISLTLEGTEAALDGEIKTDGSLDLQIKASTMGARAVRNLKPTTTSIYAGSYFGYKMMAMGGNTMYDTEIKLVLDKFGGYVYTAVDAVSEDKVNETGTYSVVGNVITFKLTDSEETVVGTLENYVVTATSKVSPQVANRSEIVAYRSNIQGEFEGVATIDEVDFPGTLILKSNGKYTLVIKENDVVLLNEEGTFKITRTMTTNLVLTHANGTRSFVVSLEKVNGNVEYDGDTYGFTFKK